MNKLNLRFSILQSKKSLIKGLATIQEMEHLQKFAASLEMREIIAKAIDDVWTRANAQLADFGRMVEPYTIGLSLGGQGFGTAVLCQYKSAIFPTDCSTYWQSSPKSKVCEHASAL